jgi:carboxypeptidase family protein
MRLRFLVALTVWWCLGIAAGAQENVNLASLAGRVTDPQGAVVPSAVVRARQTETNLIAEAATDGDGRFRFPYLRVGQYEVTVRAPGFAEAARTLTLTVGSAFDLRIALAIADVAAGVTVSGETTVLESGRSEIAGTVSQTEVRNLPLNGRNFLDLALLIPGVSPTNAGSVQLFAETSAVPGQGLSIGSQRNFSNSFIVDGLSSNDDAAGLSGIPYGVDAVDQFQVVTSGGQAELGRALGGYVNVLTKSGTNALHGDVYGYFRDGRLNARNPLSGTTLPMSQKQYGGSAGGPIVRDRTFYFGNFEQRRLAQSGLVTIAPGSVAAINARLIAAGYPGSLVETGLYANPVRTANVLGKVDHQLNGRDQATVRYSLYTVTSRNSRGAGGLNAPSASAGLDNTDQSLAFSNTFTVSPRTVNETRAQFALGNLTALPSDPVGPAVSIAGVASFGTLSGNPQGRLNRLFEVVDNLSRQAGAHALRAGVDVVYNADTIAFPRSFRGAYTFSSLADFLAGTYNNAGFVQTFGDTTVSQRNPNVGLYAQDEWKTARGVTLNAGLRYDLQFVESVETDRNNISPRLGFAWSPSSGSNTVVRGSAGLFFDRVPLRPVANALLSAGNTTDVRNLRQIVVSLSPNQASAPAFPAILAGVVPSVTLPSLTTIDPHIQNAYSRQASVEIERQLGRRATYSVGYQYVRGLDLIIALNQNVPACIAAGTNNGCRPDPSYANDTQYSSVAESNYHGLHLSFVERPGSWGHFRVSYTYSKSMNNVGENFFNGPIDPFDVMKDWGRSDDDQRHRLVLNGAVNTSMDAASTMWQRLTRGLQLSAMVQAYSAVPVNITSGLTTVQGTAARPVINGSFIPRNAGTGSSFFTASVRLSRSFTMGQRLRLDAAAEAFNVTNHRNDLTRNSNFGPGAFPDHPSATYGQVTAVGDPRSLQVAMRLKF